MEFLRSLLRSRFATVATSWKNRLFFRLTGAETRIFSVIWRSQIPVVIMRRSIRNFNIPPPGIPRAFDFASCPGRGEFEPCVGRVGNLNWIYLLFWRNTFVSFFGFCRVSPLLVNNSFKGSLKEVCRCHYSITLSERRVKCWLKTKFVFEER